MPESQQQRLLLGRKVIRNIGIALFALSFLAPPRWRGGEDFHLFGGCAAFIETPVYACQSVMENRDAAPSHPIFLFVIMMAAWLANLTVFTRLPLGVALIAILLPWPAYIYLFSILVGFVPFYPWALGIALIHFSRIGEPWPETAQEQTPIKEIGAP